MYFLRKGGSTPPLENDSINYCSYVLPYLVGLVLASGLVSASISALVSALESALSSSFTSSLLDASLAKASVDVVLLDSGRLNTHHTAYPIEKYVSLTDMS